MTASITCDIYHLRDFVVFFADFVAALLAGFLADFLAAAARPLVFAPVRVAAFLAGFLAPLLPAFLDELPARWPTAFEIPRLFRFSTLR